MSSPKDNKRELIKMYIFAFFLLVCTGIAVSVLWDDNIRGFVEYSKNQSAYEIVEADITHISRSRLASFYDYKFFYEGEEYTGFVTGGKEGNKVELAINKMSREVVCPKFIVDSYFIAVVLMVLISPIWILILLNPLYEFISKKKDMR